MEISQPFFPNTNSKVVKNIPKNHEEPGIGRNNLMAVIDYLSFNEDEGNN